PNASTTPGGPTMSEDRSVVLVVEDEKDLADLYSMWLSETYEVRTAYDAEQALELTDEDVDVVLLDRRLPGISGDEYLERIRGQGYACPVAVISAVEPDLEILEMGFNDYVVKQISKREMHELVERLLTLEEAGPETQ
ncbi:MAG: response regulator transcription factor, partial [Halobacteriales archaeon]